MDIDKIVFSILGFLLGAHLTVLGIAIIGWHYTISREALMVENIRLRQTCGDKCKPLYSPLLGARK